MLKHEDKIRSLIPDFDLLKIGEVKQISLRFRYSEVAPKIQYLDASMEFTYQRGDDRFLISLSMINVKGLTFPELGTSMFELGELDIRQVSEAREDGSKYRIIDHLDGIFCYCEDVSYDSIHQL